MNDQPCRGLANPALARQRKNERCRLRMLLETDVVPGIFVSVPDTSRIVFGQFRWEF